VSYTASHGIVPVPLTHQVPAGYQVSLYRHGFGQYLAVAKCSAGEFTAGGGSDVLALSRALAKAQKAAEPISGE